VPYSADTQYGGNTPCVEVETGEGVPLILDGGTGLHWLGDALLKSAFGRGQGTAHLLLTHLHWGHIQGIPFFPPMLIPGNHFTFYGGGGCGYSLKDLLNAQMTPTFCPVPNAFSDEIGATAEVREIDEGEFSIGRIRVTARRLHHAADTICLGYRLEDGAATLAYLPDVEYLEEAHRLPALDLARSADLLIHDAHFATGEYESCRGRGHSCDRDAVRLAREAGVGHLLLFHYHPDHSDAVRDQVARAHGDCAFVVETGREGAEYTIDGDATKGEES